jgi:hypothetical protein
MNGDDRSQVACTLRRTDCRPPPLATDRGRGKKSAKGGPKASPSWWRSLTGDDIISLEPLADLPYEPFELRASLDQDAAGGTDPYNFFDGNVLQKLPPPSMAYTLAASTCAL